MTRQAFLLCVLALLSPVGAAAAPRLVTGTMEDGTGLVTVDQPGRTASLRWVVRSGALDDPMGKPGVARLVARAILEGGYAEDGAQLRRDVERAGGRLEAATGPDATVFTLDAPTSAFLGLAGRLTRMLTDPALPRVEVGRLVQVLATGGGADPDDLRARLVPMLFPATAAQPKGITPADLVAFFEAHYLPSNMTVVVVGDMERDDVEAALEEADRLAPSTDEAPMTLPSPSARPLHRTGFSPLPRTAFGYEIGPVSSRVCRGLAGLLDLRLRSDWMYTAPRAQEVRGHCVRIFGSAFLVAEVVGGRAPDLDVAAGARDALFDVARRPATAAEQARLQAGHVAGWARLEADGRALADRVADEVGRRIAGDDLEDAILGPPTIPAAEAEALVRSWMHREHQISFELGPDA